MIVSWIRDTFVCPKIIYYVKFPQARISESSPDFLQVRVASFSYYLPCLILGEPPSCCLLSLLQRLRDFFCPYCLQVDAFPIFFPHSDAQPSQKSSIFFISWNYPKFKSPRLFWLPLLLRPKGPLKRAGFPEGFLELKSCFTTSSQQEEGVQVHCWKYPHVFGTACTHTCERGHKLQCCRSVLQV